MRRLAVVLAFAALFTRPALAVVFTTNFPSDPVFIAGPQGRPIPNATVTVADPATGNPVVVFADPAGTIPFPSVLNATQIVQFYAPPGIYLVVVSGSGLTKQFYVLASAENSGMAKKVALNIRAQSWRPYNANVDPDLACLTPIGPTFEAIPCFRTFDDQQTQRILTDFVFPSFPLAMSSFEIEWMVGVAFSGGSVIWHLDWCVTEDGQPYCNPSGANETVFTSPGQANPNKITVSAVPPAFNPPWTAGQHVTLLLSREPGDTLSGNADFINAKIEWTQP